jgi:hypothetical protein
MKGSSLRVLAARRLGRSRRAHSIRCCRWWGRHFARGQTRPGLTFSEGLGGYRLCRGRNVAIEYHWARRQYDRPPALARFGVQSFARPGGNLTGFSLFAPSLGGNILRVDEMLD